MANKIYLIIVWSLVFGLFSITVFGQKTTTQEAENKEKKKSPLIGKWISSEAKIEFFENGTITINGEKYKFAIVKNVIVVGNDEGQIQVPFSLKDDTLVVLFEGRKVVYTRSKGDDEEVQPQNTNRGGSTPQELVGTWCYQADIQANNGGGRHSRICFTLRPNGTYEYSSGSSNTNPNGGSVSESTDYGRWSATATTLTARSNSGETRTYTLEKRNHPKTGDPMLIVDGDAFVTQYQKRPW